MSDVCRQGNAIPLRLDLADGVGNWLAVQLASRRKATRYAATIKFRQKARTGKAGSQDKAEEAERSSSAELLFDVPGAVEALPELKLNGTDSSDFEAIRATGTFGTGSRQLAPLLAPSRTNQGQSESLAVASTT